MEKKNQDRVKNTIIFQLYRGIPIQSLSVANRRCKRPCPGVEMSVLISAAARSFSS